MDEFVLQDEVPGAAAQPIAQFVREIIEEAGPIMPPGQTHHLDPVPPPLQGLDQVAVVQEPAGQGVQAAVEDQRYGHVISSVQAAQATSLSQIATVTVERLRR